ncbi:MAG: hypothetical protein Q4C29_03650 [bacterium]|nr:hypothetical protein [bacterium]
MNKYIKIAIVVLVVVGVFLLSFLVRGKQTVKGIDFNEYQSIVKDGGYVYYGSVKAEKSLKEFSDLYGLEISILDPDSLSESENKEIKLKDNTIYNYKNGKSTFSYSGDMSLEKIAKSFSKKGLIRTYENISLDKYLKIIKSNGDHFMFIGSDSCGYCDKFKVSIIEALKDYDFNVYYLNIQNLSEDELSTLYATDKYFEENEWGTPLNFLYKDGKRVGELNGYVETDALVSYLKENKVI